MASGSESVSFFFLAYFDEKSIPLVVRDFHRVLEKTGRDFELIVVDDGSPDRTGEVADRLAKEFAKVRVIHHRKNKGYAGAITTGFSAARKELVGYTDGDGQYSAADLPRFLEEIKDCDFVTGYRKNRADGLSRVFFHNAYKLLLFLVLGMRFRDPDCGFKLVRKTALPKIKAVSKSSFFVAEMLYNAKRNGLAVKEIPVKHLRRRFGTSKCLKTGQILAMFFDLVRKRFGKN